MARQFLGLARTLFRRCLAAMLVAAMPAIEAADAPAPEDAAVPAFKSLDSMEARVQGCVTCHGQNGQGTSSGYFPRIAGKPAGYLYNQLTAFRDGTRRYAPMNYLVAYLPDPYLHEIAEYFSKQQPPFAARQQDAVAGHVTARGQSIVLSGDPQQGVPACVACHGATLSGMNPGIPGLLGLQQTYITAQLTRWRVGERHAKEPDCMKRIASRLSDSDVVAVSAWLSQQEAPKSLSPEPANLNRMPLACGSQQAAP